MTLLCKMCASTVDLIWDSVDGVPVHRWFAERGELCERCWANRAARRSDPVTSQRAADDVAIRSGSQRHQLLQAYADGSELNADEAMRRSGVGERSCYWKRISELVDAELLVDTGAERLGERGSMQRVNRITEKGAAALGMARV